LHDSIESDSSRRDQEQFHLRESVPGRRRYTDGANKLAVLGGKCHAGILVATDANHAAASSRAATSREVGRLYWKISVSGKRRFGGFIEVPRDDMDAVRALCSLQVGLPSGALAHCAAAVNIVRGGRIGWPRLSRL
jgi:hypothetical protein